MLASDCAEVLSVKNLDLKRPTLLRPAFLLVFTRGIVHFLIRSSLRSNTDFVARVNT